MDTARRQGQFHSQLASGDLIGQAKGILMARFNITALEAFELLKRLSEDRNAQLVDITRQLTSRMHFSDL